MNAMREPVSVDSLTLALSYTCLRAPACGYACAYTHDTSRYSFKTKQPCSSITNMHGYMYTRTRMHLYAYILQVNWSCDNIVFVGFN